MREGIINKLKDVGKLESFEIKNSSLVLAIVGIGLYIYSLIIFHFNSEAVEIRGAREFFTILFLVSAFIPFTKNKFVLSNKILKPHERIKTNRNEKQDGCGCKGDTASS